MLPFDKKEIATDVNQFSFQWHTLGRIEGLLESCRNKPDQALRWRIKELFGLLKPEFVVFIFTEGLPSDRERLEMLAKL